MQFFFFQYLIYRIGFFRLTGRKTKGTSSELTRKVFGSIENEPF
jgi:hypothetical protein